MRIVFFSDVHGCVSAVNVLFDRIKEIRPDKFVMLGDALYHGPRNALPSLYSAKDTAEHLNHLKDNMIAVRGNCDAEVDQMMLDFPMMADYSTMLLEHGFFFLTHGHIFHPDHLPPLSDGSVFVSGHTHIPVLHRKSGIIFFNPGSVSIPKGGYPPSFGVLENDILSVRSLLDGKIILDSVRLEK